MKLIILFLALFFPLTGDCSDSATLLEEHSQPEISATREKEKAATAPVPEEHGKDQSKHAPHWAYRGEAGPDHWGEINATFAACGQGKQQSPVDLKWSSQRGVREIEFHYEAANATVIDNGHTIQVNMPEGSFAVIDGHRYDLKQFHFHTPSEHTFSGKHFPLEMHLVHKDPQGKTAVVGVIFDTGKKNEALAKVFGQWPRETGKEQPLAGKFDPSGLLPAARTHYQYSGSLTTPPCSEGLNWSVLNSPLELSEEQLTSFQTNYVSNNRPVQPLHDRKPASFR